MFEPFSVQCACQQCARFQFCADRSDNFRPVTFSVNYVVRHDWVESAGLYPKTNTKSVLSISLIHCSLRHYRPIGADLQPMGRVDTSAAVNVIGTNNGARKFLLT